MFPENLYFAWMKINRVFIVFWSALLVFSSLNAQSPKDIYSSGILMEGKIGGKYAIQLRLSGDDVHDFFEFKTDECREVRGEYCYLSQMKPLALNGKICPKNETLLLSFATTDPKFE